MERMYELPYAHGEPLSQGKIRQQPEDFIVQEQLRFEPKGEGEHVFLEIEKRGENTDYVAGQLARFANLSKRDIGYAGLKDRHAVTTQWFSIWLPGRDALDWSVFATDTIKILKIDKHLRKLKRGALSGNYFNITVKDWQGNKAELTRRFERIKQQGVPNYFGEQRFGRGGQNVEKALAFFRGAKAKRNQRSIYLSAARSYLFNLILSQRIKHKSWNQAIAGDLLMLNNTGSYFKSVNQDQETIQRVMSGQIHPTGALWGEGVSEVEGVPLEIEQTVINKCCDLASGLEKIGLRQERRALRVNVDSLRWQFFDNNSFELSFFLPAGSYATAVLRECLNYKIG